MAKWKLKDPTGGIEGEKDSCILQQGSSQSDQQTKELLEGDILGWLSQGLHSYLQSSCLLFNAREDLLEKFGRWFYISRNKG